MSEWYNPIVRTFCQYRVALRKAAGLPRERVTTSAQLETIVPPSCRRRVWTAVRLRGLRMPPLELAPLARVFWAVLVLLATVGVRIGSGEWWAAAVALGPAWYVAFRLSRPWAVRVPPFVRTVGELTVYGTRFRDHVASGYRWSHGDVSLKVRLLVAESLALPLERVQPETTFEELTGC